MRVEPGVVIVDSIHDVLSSHYPAPFKVLRNHFLSAWHYVLYMNAMRLKLFGTAECILAAAIPDELDALAAPAQQADPGMRLQHAWSDMELATWKKFQAHSSMLDLLLGTDTKLIVSTTHPDTFRSAPLLAEGQHLSDKTTWIGRNAEGIALMRTRDEIVWSRASTSSRSPYTEPVSLHTKIDMCWAWNTENSSLSPERYAAWVAHIRSAPSVEVVNQLYAYMRSRYWDVDINHPGRAELIRWVRSELSLELPADPALLGNEQGS